MKKLFYLFGSVAACAAIFASCSKMEPEETELLPETPGEVTMTIHALDNGSKTYVDGTTIKWADSGEYLKVFEDAEGSVVSRTSSAGTTTDSGATMSFNVSFDSRSASSFNYYALYPASNYQTGSDITSIRINTPSEQTPTASSFDPSADLLIAQPINNGSTQAASLSMYFARVLAIGKMTVKNLESDEDIESITFSVKKGGADVVLAGRTNFNINTGIAATYGEFVEAKTIKLNYEGQSIKGSTSMDAWFTCYPFSLSATGTDSFKVIVETASKTFTKEVTLTGSQTLAFKEGLASRFSVDMDGITGTSKAVDLCYAYLDYSDYSSAGGVSSYGSVDISKTHGDIWKTFACTNNSSRIQIRKNDSTNDSYIKLPVFEDNIKTVIVTLGVSMAAGNYLSLETTATGTAGSIDIITTTESTTSYTFDLSAKSFKTGYLRSKGSAAYITKIEVYAGDDTRTKLSSPTNVTAVRNTSDAEVTNTIDVSWDSVSGAAGYQVTLTPTAGDPITYNTANTTYSFTGLAYSTSYTPTVIAVADPYINLDSDAGAGAAAATIAAPAIASLTTAALSSASANSYGTLQSITSDGYSWKHTGNVAAGNAYLQMNASSYIELPIVPGTIDRIVFSVTSASGTADGDTGNKCTNNLTFTCIDGTISSSVDTETGVNSITLVPTAATYRNGKITASGALRIWSIKVYYTADAASISSIDITTDATKTTYSLNEAISFDGTVKATYSNSSIADVSSLVSATGDTSTAGSKDVTVSYSEQSDTYGITVTSSLSVTYTVTSTSAVNTTGTAPDGSSATYSQTHDTAQQMTSGNSITLTLSGFDGKKITGATVSVKSNSKGGGGSLSLKTGETTIASISDSKFNTPSWNGAWSTTYVDKELSVTETTIATDATIVLTIAATANSLYFESLTLTYE